MIILQVRGGLGNQMFQYAFARTLSKESNDEKIYLYIENFKYDDLREYALNHLYLSSNIKVVNKSILLRIYRKFFLLVAKIWKIEEDNPKDALKLYRMGFFQYLRNNEVIPLPKCRIPIKYFSCVFLNEYYFKGQEELMKRELLVKTTPSEENQKWIKLISNTENSVCIHIRRGDYVEKKKYLICTDEYYKKAVKCCQDEINEKVTFFVFSEDVFYAKSLQLAEENIYYMDLNNPDYEELRLMYNCKHFIISNSTFSWWAQYLSQGNGIVISPKYWSKTDTKISELNNRNWILM